MEDNNSIMDRLHTIPPRLFKLKIVPKRLSGVLIQAEERSDLPLLITAFTDDPAALRGKNTP
jgi:hypothetical protein